MKDELLKLIDKIPEIESKFSWSEEISGMPTTEIIYNVQDFKNWIHELQYYLQDIVDRTADEYALKTLEIAGKDFKGWRDREDFNSLKARLLVMHKNIDRYYTVKEIESEVGDVTNKKPKIFISHSSKDEKYVKEIVDLLDYFGLNQTQLFCSSLPGYDIPVNKNIFNYLLEQFNEFNLHIIFIHSKNYYLSPISLNEMGAAWILKNNYTSLLLPGFSFNEMRGVINSSDIAIKLDNDEFEVKDKLNQLYDIVAEEFELEKKPHVAWEQKRNSFINKMKAIYQNTLAEAQSQEFEAGVSADALKLLKLISEDSTGQISRVSDLSGLQIQVAEILINEKGNTRDTVMWDSVLDELISNKLVKQVDNNGMFFQITKSGYLAVEKE